MTDILDNSKNANELSTQQGRSIPNLNLAPSSYVPPVNNVPVPPVSNPEQSVPQAPLLESSAPFGTPPEAPASKRATPQDILPQDQKAPQAPQGIYTSNFSLAPDKDTQFLNDNPNNPYFKVPPKAIEYQPAPDSGIVSRVDANSENDLARLQGLTNQQVQNKQINEALSNANSLQPTQGSAVNFIPQPQKWEYESTPVNKSLAALIEADQTQRTADYRGRNQYFLEDLKNRPFDIIVPQFDNSSLFENAPTSSELVAHRESLLLQQKQPVSPIGIPIDSTGNALINQASGMTNLLNGYMNGGADSKRKEGQPSVVDSLFSIAKKGVGNLAELGGLIVGAPIALADFGNGVSRQLAMGRGFGEAFSNAAKDTAANTWYGRAVVNALGNTFKGTPDGESAVRPDQVPFNPFQGQFRDYGTGLLGGAFYLADLPGNLLTAAVYSGTDAAGLDRKMGGQAYTGNRFMDAFAGRNTTFTQRRDNVAYLTPVTRDPKKTQTEAIGQWSTSLFLDVATGHFGSAALNAASGLGTAAARKLGINIGAQGSTETAARFAARSVPPVNAPSPATSSTVTSANYQRPQLNPSLLRAVEGGGALPSANRPGQRALPASNVIVPPPGKPNAFTPPTPQNVPTAVNATSYIFNSSATLNPKPASWTIQQQAMQTTNEMTAKLAAYNLTNANNAIRTGVNNAVETQVVRSTIQKQAAQQVNNPLGMTTAERINQARGIPNYRPSSLGITNPSVPNAPMTVTPVLTPTQVIQRANPEAALIRNVTPILEQGGTLAPLNTLQRQANFVDSAINGGAFSAAQDGSLRMTSEVFAERLARKQTLEAKAGALTVTLQRNLPGEVRTATLAEFKKVQDELASYTNIEGNWSTVNTTAVRMADDATMPVTSVKPQQSEALAKIKTVQNELDGVIDEARRLAPEGSLDELFGTKPVNQMEGIKPSAALPGTPPSSQLALGASPAPSKFLEGTNTPQVLTSLQEALAPKLSALVANAEKNNISIQRLLASRDLPSIPAPTIEKIIGRKLVPITEDLFTIADSIVPPAPKLDIPSYEELFSQAGLPPLTKLQPSSPTPQRAAPLVTESMVNEAIPVIKSADLVAPVRPVDVQKTSRVAQSKRAVPPAVEPVLVKSTRRTNAQLTELARNTIDPETGAPIWRLKRTMSTKEVAANAEKYGDLLSRHGKAIDEKALAAPIKRIEVEAADVVTGKASVSFIQAPDKTVSNSVVDELTPGAPDFTNAANKGLPGFSSKVPHSISELALAITSINGSDAKKVAEALKDVWQVPSYKPMSMDEYLKINDTATDLFKKASSVPVGASWNGVMPHEASERWARWLGHTELEAALAAPPGEPIKNLEDVFGIENPIGGASLFAPDTKMGAAFNPLLKDWTKRAGLTIFDKANPADKYRIAQLMPTELEALGINADFSKLKVETVIVKDVPIQKIEELTTKAITKAGAVDVANISDIKVLNEELEKVFNSIDATWKIENKAAREASLDAFMPYKNSIEARIWALEDLEELKATAPVSQLKPSIAPKDAQFDALQQEVATLQTNLIEQGKAAADLERKMLEMQPFINQDADLLADIKYQGRGQIDNEYLTQERFGLITPDENPSRLRLERVDIGGVNSKTVKELPGIVLNDNTKVTNLDGLVEKLDIISPNQLDEATRFVNKEKLYNPDFIDFVGSTAIDVKSKLSEVSSRGKVWSKTELLTDVIFDYTDGLDNEVITKLFLGDKAPLGAWILAPKNISDEAKELVSSYTKFGRKLAANIYDNAPADQKLEILKLLKDPDSIRSIGVSWKAGTIEPPAINLKRAVALSGDTWYHGTKSDLNDLTVLDPIKGASFSELGSGIHFTDDSKVAAHYAKALIPENRTPVGDVRTDAVGSVFQVNLMLGNTASAKDPISKNVGKKFNAYLKENHPDIYANWRATKNTEVGALMLNVREAAQELEGALPVGEARMLDIQRAYTTFLKEDGIDSIMSSVPGGSRTVNVLDPTLISSTKKSPVGDGSLMEGLTSRKYLDDISATQFPESSYTKANQVQSRYELEKQIHDDLAEQWKEEAIKTEDMARKLGEKTAALEERGIAIKNDAANKIEAASENAPKKQLKQFMEDTDNLCL